MRTAVLSALAIFSVLSGYAAEPDPLIGNWRWNNKHRVEIRADNTVTSPWGGGKWKLLPSPTVERKYEIDWEANATVSIFALASDGKRFVGKNNRGQKEVATRLE
jgi:hypothetical protein